MRGLQVVGMVWILFGAIPLAIGAARNDENIGAFALIAVVCIIAGLFALAGGLRRPVGLVFGVVSLSLMLVTLIGAFFVAIIGFLAAKDREQVREFYASGIKR